jgi:hypothetical protein
MLPRLCLWRSRIADLRLVRLRAGSPRWHGECLAARVAAAATTSPE